MSTRFDSRLLERYERDVKNVLHLASGSLGKTLGSATTAGSLGTILVSATAAGSLRTTLGSTTAAAAIGLMGFTATSSRKHRNPDRTTTGSSISSAVGGLYSVEATRHKKKLAETAQLVVSAGTYACCPLVNPGLLHVPRRSCHKLRRKSSAHFAAAAALSNKSHERRIPALHYSADVSYSQSIATLFRLCFRVAQISTDATEPCASASADSPARPATVLWLYQDTCWHERLCNWSVSEFQNDVRFRRRSTAERSASNLCFLFFFFRFLVDRCRMISI